VLDGACQLRGEPIVFTRVGRLAAIVGGQPLIAEDARDVEGQRDRRGPLDLKLARKRIVITRSSVARW
jgi:hypothetical protein